MKRNTVIINLFGAPCAGKSTSAAYLFSRFKQDGYRCELVTEYAKDLVYENNTVALADQLYIFGNQHFRIFRLMGKVDIIITDSPIENSIYYNTNSFIAESLENLIRDVATQYQSIGVFLHLNSVDDYDPSDRLQSKEEALKMEHLLLEKSRPFIDFESNKYILGADLGYKKLLTLLKKKYEQ
ncbi:AAA family ATPase [Eubacteriaceae bacterium ES3]|nr:AAA family ATPase [Eubacteriaceae bacterium ES3]